MLSALLSWVCKGTGSLLALVSIDPSAIHFAVCVLSAEGVLWPSLGVMKSVMPSDSELLSVVCFGPNVLALLDSVVRFVPGELSSGVPAGLESVTVCDSTVSAACVFAGEGCVMGLGFVPGTRVL